MDDFFKVVEGDYEPYRMWINKNQNKVSINAKNKNGDTALIHCLKQVEPNSDIIGSLVSSRFADINARSLDGSTVDDLISKIWPQNPEKRLQIQEIINDQRFLDDLRKKDKSEKNAMIIEAAKANDFALVQIIVGEGGDFSFKNEQGESALPLFVSQNNLKAASSEVPIDCAKILSQCLEIATRDNNPEMIQTLLFHRKAKMNQQSYDNAFEAGGEEMVARLKELSIQSSLFSIKKMSQEIQKDDGEIETKTHEILVPTYEANLVLSQNYLLKYGIKIGVSRNGLSIAQQDFICEKFEQDSDFKFAVVMDSDTYHKSLVIFEKKGEENFMICMDSLSDERATTIISRHEDLFRCVDALIPNLQMWIPKKSANLQAHQGCTTHAISMAKDALRLPSVVAEFEEPQCKLDTIEEEETYGWDIKEFEQFPTKFLKYAESSRATKGIDLTTINILRSSPRKEEKTLHDYRKTHAVDEVVRGELRPNRNHAIYSKNAGFFEKTKRVLDYYRIDDTNLADFLKKLDVIQENSLNDVSFRQRIYGQEEILEEAKKASTSSNPDLKELPFWSRVEPSRNVEQPGHYKSVYILDLVGSR